MARGDTVIAPFPFYLDDFEADVPARWSDVDRWRYLKLLCHLWKHGFVLDDDYEIAIKAGVKPVGSYAKATAKLRQSLCLHPDKEGALTQKRIHQDRSKYLENRTKDRERQKSHRGKSRVTAEPVTASYPYPSPYPYSDTNVSAAPDGDGAPVGEQASLPIDGSVIPDEAPEEATTTPWQHVQWLTVKSGRTEPAVRSWLGRMIGKHGEDAMLEVLSRCHHEGPVDPFAWCTKAMRTTRRAKGNGVDRYGRPPEVDVVELMRQDRERAEAESNG